MTLVVSNRDKTAQHGALTVGGRSSSILAHPRYTLTPNLQNKSAGSGAVTSPSPVTSCDISPDGRLLVSSTMDHKIFLWVRTPAAKPNSNFAAAGAVPSSSSHHHRHFVCIASYSSLKAPATRVRFAGSSHNLIVASLASGFVAVIDIEAGKLDRMIRPPKPEKIMFQTAVVLNDVAVAPPEVSPECKMIASAGDDGRISVFDLRISQSSTSGAKCFQTPVPQTAVAFAPASAASAAAAAADESTATRTGAAVGVAVGPAVGLFSGGVDGSLRWLQLRGGEMRCAVECLDAHDDVISGIDTNSNCSTGVVLSYSAFASSLRVHDLRPWSRDSQRVLFEDNDVCDLANSGRKLPVDRSLLRCSFSTNGTSIAAGTAFGAVAVYENWQEEQQKRQQSRNNSDSSSISSSCRFYVNPHASSVTDCKFHPQSDAHGEIVLTTGSIDGSCVVACA